MPQESALGFHVRTMRHHRGAGKRVDAGVKDHSRYYPRFGFKRASQFGIRWEREVADDVFFALELTRDALKDVSGVVRYSPEFAMV